MTSKRPIIGVTLDIEPDNDSYSAYPWYALRCNYLESNCDRYSEKFRFRDRCERVLFLRYGKGTVYLQIPCLLKNFEMPK